MCIRDRAVSDKGMCFFCIVSKADEVDKAVERDISMLAYSNVIHDLRERVHKHARVEMNKVCIHRPGI